MKMEIDISKNFNPKIRYLVSEDVVTDIKCQCTDKLKAKDYISSFPVSDLIKIPKVLKIIGKKLDIKEIDFKQYQFPLYIKCNHGCRYQKYCVDIKDINKYTERILNKYMRQDHGLKWNECQYNKIDKTMYIEECIKIDYLMQFYCFHGNPLFLECIKKDIKTNKSICCNEYNIRYEQFIFTNCVKKYELTPKPSFYDKLVYYTKQICHEFDFVRVDYYVDINKDVYFSELTFSPSAGHLEFKNEEMDNYFGSFL